MFKAALRSARPAALAARAGARATPSLRALSTSAVRRSDDHKAAAPPIYGPGAKPGEVPTDAVQSTGLDRVETLGLLEGVNVFDLEPLDASRIGTLADPIKVFSVEPERIVGCTGSPADSHDLHWFNVNSEKPRRCPECGSAYIIEAKPNEVTVTEIYPQEEVAAPHHH
ncbi:COX5B-domain-containing protein [Dentipellis sp. KUC8613]|nr:COX5B-domain-containing protein [Dentipellis sp. KUC8613]